MSTSTLWTTVKDELRERREAREAMKALRADLAHYRTPAEIDDLLASVDAEDSREAELIREHPHGQPPRLPPASRRQRLTPPGHPPGCP